MEGIINLRKCPNFPFKDIEDNLVKSLQHIMLEDLELPVIICIRYLHKDTKELNGSSSVFASIPLLDLAHFYYDSCFLSGWSFAMIDDSHSAPNFTLLDWTT